GNDVLPQEQLQYFVLTRAATGGLMRKLFCSESRNWSFYTASASAIGLFLFGETLRVNVAFGAGIVVAAGIFTLWRQRVREKAALRQAQA
ncbi:MAG: hypothetical protein ACKO2N_02935, partial [Tabrizicola sp.]